MTRLLDDAAIKALAREESVRGSLVRLALEQADGADEHEREILEESLQLLLERFQVVAGDTP